MKMIEVRQTMTTSRIETLRTLSAGLSNMTEDTALRKVLSDLADDFRFSDPVSGAATADIEQELENSLRELSGKLSGGNATLEEVQKLRKLLEQRNALLREVSSQTSLRGLLDDWDEVLARCGAQIISTRREALEELSVRAREEHRMLTGSSEELKLRYSGEAADRDDTVQSLLEGLRKNREDDIRRMTTSIGPHRDDIKIYINGKECKIYASQGQQRSAVLSLRLAQLTYFEKEKKESPILMLDDVMSELDPRRRICLIERIDQIQTFVTCTDASDIVSSKTGKMYMVHDGKIQSDDYQQGI